MIASALLFLLGLFGLLGVINAIRPANPDHHPLFRSKWFAQLAVAELATHRFVMLLAAAVVLILLGALERTVGTIGLVLVLISLAGYVYIQLAAYRVRRSVTHALAAAGVDGERLPGPVWKDILIAYPRRVPGDIERVEDIAYAPGLDLDLYRSRTTAGQMPSLLQIHGGSWSGGNRRQQARPLLHTMARNGWAGVSVSYSVSPDATYPDHVIDLKRALLWIRTEGAAFGLDPDRIVVTGGSAGGHLAAVVALTANDPQLQPGFEDFDTSVQGAVPLYGIYDFVNRNQTRDPWPFIADNVMKAEPEADPARYRLASPLDLVHPAAPPFFVIHGAHDTLVPIREARHFVAALRATSRAPVAYLEVPGANHSFDAIASVRTQYVVAGITRFLDGVLRIQPDRRTTG